MLPASHVGKCGCACLPEIARQKLLHTEVRIRSCCRVVFEPMAQLREIAGKRHRGAAAMRKTDCRDAVQPDIGPSRKRLAPASASAALSSAVTAFVAQTSL